LHQELAVKSDCSRDLLLGQELKPLASKSIASERSKPKSSELVIVRFRWVREGLDARLATSTDGLDEGNKLLLQTRSE
jgi:hypothetical protein